MLRLVETDFPSARKQDLGDRAPSSFLYLRTLDATLIERRYLRLQIVTH